MSVGSHSLKRPVLITVVVVMGIAVTILNIRTFGARKQGPHAAPARAQAFMGLPGDLNDVVRVAGRDMRDGIGDAPPQGNAYRDPVRDPFMGDEPVAVSTHLAPEKAPDKTKRHTAGVPECTAVLPGGGLPLAVIKGKARQVGEVVNGWTIEAIHAGGVVMRDARGRERTLAVVPAHAAAKFSVSSGQEPAPVKDDSERMEP